MALLTYRTNLLLSAQEHQAVAAVAKQKNQTISQTIRQAVRKTYMKNENAALVERRTKNLKRLRELSKNVNTKGINYRELIEEGRKY